MYVRTLTLQTIPHFNAHSAHSNIPLIASNATSHHAQGAQITIYFIMANAYLHVLRSTTNPLKFVKNAWRPASIAPHLLNVHLV